jgi:DNA-binding response OmpR family regulator/DNA-binding CsgD family transcriptional regulator
MHDRIGDEVVLIVDDVPENLALLHDALDEAGYVVLVATSGESALQSARQNRPDVILLDALMPGMDGFQLAQALKADFDTQNIPIIFMTGLTETESVVAAFASGGSDYVTKPIRPQEVLARIAAHMQNARHIKQARTTLDRLDQAAVTIHEAEGRIVWKTPQAWTLLNDYFGMVDEQAPPPLMEWVVKVREAASRGQDAPIILERDTKRLLGSVHPGDSDQELVITLREENRGDLIQALSAAFGLTLREAEVLFWVVSGKTNREIGMILGSSRRTVDKHLEHVFEKLGVETRTSAAGLAMKRVKMPALG